MSYKPALYNVPNVAALTALATASLADGEIVFVTSVMNPWIYMLNGAALVVDGITVANTAAGGTTRWARLEFSHPIWRIGRDFWYIDPVAGNDENTGLTAGTAIKTGAEHARRWGRGNLVTQSGVSANSSVNIIILNDVVAPDFLQIDCMLSGITELLVQGTPTVIATSPAGATAITNENQATNTPWDLTDAVTSGALAVGMRLRWTAGVAINACAWVAKSLGASKWRMSNPSLSDPAAFSTVPVNKIPAVGNAYVVERLTQVNIGIINIYEQAATAGGFNVFVQFIDLEFHSESAGGNYLNGGPPALFTRLVFLQCRFVDTQEINSVSYSNCAMAATQICRKSIFISGGLAYGVNTILEWQSNNEGQLQNDLYVQGTRGILADGCVVVGNVAIFDSIVGALPGDGITVGLPAANANNGVGFLKCNGLVWGNGNGGVGIRVRSGCTMIYSAMPSVTGAGGDFVLDTGGKARFFNETTGVYSAVIAETWANLVAAQPAGFGGQAHNLSEACHIVPFA